MTADYQDIRLIYMKTVSIITPVFEAKASIERAVYSLIAQTYPHWEMLIVSDDGQDYEAFLKTKGVSDKRLRFLSTKQIGAGVSAARNVGLKEAKGNVLGLLDATDEYYPNRLQRLFGYTMEYGMAGDNARVVNEFQKDVIVAFFAETVGMHLMSAQEYAGTVMPMSFLYRRDVITLAWDEWSGAAEKLFNLRAFEQARGVLVLGECLHEHHPQAGGQWSIVAGLQQPSVTTLDQFQPLGFMSPQYSALAQEVIQRSRKFPPFSMPLSKVG